MNNQLPAELQEHFEIVGEWPAKFHVTGLEVSVIEWSKMTKQYAEHLISEGWNGLRKKKLLSDLQEKAQELKTTKNKR